MGEFCEFYLQFDIFTSRDFRIYLNVIHVYIYEKNHLETNDRLRYIMYSELIINCSANNRHSEAWFTKKFITC